jgi:hypothetical protein
MARMICPTRELIAKNMQMNGVMHVPVILCTRYAKNPCKMFEVTLECVLGNEEGGEVLSADLDGGDRDGRSCTC